MSLTDFIEVRWILLKLLKIYHNAYNNRKYLVILKKGEKFS